MTTSFPLLKLPLIPLELIINQLEFLDLLQLSMKSSKFKRLLQLLKLSVQTLSFFISKKSYGISIRQNRNCSYIDACDSMPVDTVTELAKIQEEPMEIWKHSRTEVKVKSALSKLATLEAITKYILSISKVTSYAFNHVDAQTEIRSLFIWQITTQMDQLHIFSSSCGLVQISPEDLMFILENISVAHLRLNVDCPGFKYQKPIKHSVIFSQSPSWIDFETFSLAPNIERASFLNQKVSSDVLNRLIKDWAKGKHPKLENVQFTWDDNDPETVAMARGHQTPHPKTILPNRNVEQLKGRCINHLIERDIDDDHVSYRVQLYVDDDFGVNGIHLEDQA